jgi:hypothetical protein
MTSRSNTATCAMCARETTEAIDVIVVAIAVATEVGIVVGTEVIDDTVAVEVAIAAIVVVVAVVVAIVIQLKHRKAATIRRMMPTWHRLSVARCQLESILTPSPLLCASNLV